MIAAYADSAAPVQRVWDVLSDVTSWPAHLSTFTSVAPLDGDGLAVGSRFLVRQPGLRAATYEVTHLTEGEAFTWVARAPGVTTRASHVIRARGRGSRLELGIDWSGWLARPVVALLGGRTRRTIELEATTFARLAEGK